MTELQYLAKTRITHTFLILIIKMKINAFCHHANEWKSHLIFKKKKMKLPLQIHVLKQYKIKKTLLESNNILSMMYVHMFKSMHEVMD